MTNLLKSPRLIALSAIICCTSLFLITACSGSASEEVTALPTPENLTQNDSIASSTVVAPTNIPITVTIQPTPIPSTTPTNTPTLTPVSTATPIPSPTTIAPTSTYLAFQNEGEEAIEIDYGVPGVEGPVTARLLQTYEDPTAASRLDPNAVRVVAAEARNGFTAVTVYPAFIEVLDIYEADVLIDGVVHVTQFADLDLVYLNNSGITTKSTVRVWDGLSIGATRDHDVSELTAFLGQPVIVVTAGDFPSASSSPEAVLIGEPRSKVSSADILSQFQTGGEGIRSGWTYNIYPY